MNNIVMAIDANKTPSKIKDQEEISTHENGHKNLAPAYIFAVGTGGGGEAYAGRNSLQSKLIR